MTTSVHYSLRSLTAIFVVVSFVATLSASAAIFTETGAMSVPRFAHTATLLKDGSVLVAGGSVSNDMTPTASAEIFDPLQGKWMETRMLNTGRYYHSATLLRDGTVLVTGGDGDVPWLNSSEIYNPATHLWHNVAPLNLGRELHTATLLWDGQVLVVGGYEGLYYGNLDCAELYDPVRGRWTKTASLHTARFGHQATLLPNGTVLVTGGAQDQGVELPIVLSSVELYVPIAKRWFAMPSMNIPRWQHTATVLPDGEVLVAGGWRWTDHGQAAINSAEIFNPRNGRWTMVAPMNEARCLPAAALLRNGSVLVTGGTKMGANGDIVDLFSAEAFNPISKTWTQTASMNEGRVWPTATVLQNGKVLVAGGVVTNGTLMSAELFSY